MSCNNKLTKLNLFVFKYFYYSGESISKQDKIENENNIESSAISIGMKKNICHYFFFLQYILILKQKKLILILAETIQQKRKHRSLHGEVTIKCINEIKKKKSEISVDKTGEYYSVSDDQEVYLCINATNKEHDCEFGLCRDCYEKKASPSRKTTRRKPDIDDSTCNHECYSSLDQFFDKQFFTTKYMESVKRRGIAWVSNCNYCNIKFVSMGRNGKIN